MITENAPKKIVFVEFLEHGGSATALLNFINYINTNLSGIFECVVISSKNSIFEIYKDKYKFRLYSYPSEARGLDDFIYHPVKTISEYLKVLFFTLKVILKERPQLIHTYHYMWSIYTNPVGLITNTQVLIYLCDVWMLRSKLSRILMKFNPRTRYIAVSQYVYYLFTKKFNVKREKVDLIYDGVKGTDFEALSKREIESKFSASKKLITYVSRVAPERDIEKFIELAAILHKTDKNLRFNHLGYHSLFTDKNYFKSLNAMVKKLGIGEVFKFVSYYEDPKDVYSLFKKSFLLVIPARQFALPNIAIQSMMVGTPVIAYKTGGNTEIIQNSKNGILIDVNSPFLFAESILKIMARSKDYISLALAAQKDSRNKFEASKNYPHVLSVYHRLNIY